MGKKVDKKKKTENNVDEIKNDPAFDSLRYTTKISVEDVASAANALQRNEELEKNGKGGLIVLILIVVILGLVGYIGYDKLFVSKQNNNKPKEVENNKEVEPIKTNDKVEESELTDDDIKKEVSSKVSMILSGGNSRAVDIDSVKVDIDYLDSLNDYNPTTDKKLEIVLYNNLEKFTKITENDIERIKPIFEIVFDGEGDINRFINSNETIIDSSIIENAYTELFGTKPVNKSITGCSNYYYSASTNIYLHNETCRGSGYNTITYYKNKYTQKGNNVYVYVSIKANEELDEEIVKNNYLEYEQYKFVFEKSSNGTYSYKTTEKLI
ncbi:MAG: hypothetical protein IJ565_00115 [Bacilli bacterium]|nr:hypothetical protein [Bacilli bacterium]